MGDDFPAIFPLALALMFFFGAIMLTYQNYNFKKDTVTLMRANLALARAVRSQLDFDQQFWEDDGGACDTLDKTKANYGVMAQMRLIEIKDGEMEDVKAGGYRFEPCGDTKDMTGKDIPSPDEFVVSMTYPVVVTYPQAGINQTLPRTLVITTWM